MPVREFTDSRGVEWRVWDVTPKHMHPVTRGEDYMANLQDGWLVFECGSEKRRLEAPYPSGWTKLPLPRLEELCRRASLVIRPRSRTPTGERRATSAAEIERAAEKTAGARRVFVSPGGREWTVRVHECLDRAGDQRKVLRFTAGDIVVELMHWPERWEQASVQEYALMLLDAEPPRRRGKIGPQRRHEDRDVTAGPSGQGLASEGSPGRL